MALGFDVLGWEGGSLHSYVCNSLEGPFAWVLGITPNRYGLFDRLDDARPVCRPLQLGDDGEGACLLLLRLVASTTGAWASCGSKITNFIRDYSHMVRFSESRKTASMAVVVHAPDMI